MYLAQVVLGSSNSARDLADLLTNLRADEAAGPFNNENYIHITILESQGNDQVIWGLATLFHT